jgi:signal transduction histidine kinase
LKELVSILLVDDDEEDYILTRDIIEAVNHRRYTVDWVGTYDKAREVIARQEHDIYLIDYRLGVRSGLELIREFNEKGCECPMILLTGQDDFEVDYQALNAGAADFLVKNQLSRDQLERAVRYALAQSQNLREIRLLNADLEARVERRTQALRQAVLDLRQSQLLYTSIANNFPNGFLLILDREHRLELAGGSSLDLLETKGEALQGRYLPELLPASQREAVSHFLERVFSGEALTLEVENGGRIFNYRGAPLAAPNGEIARALIVCNDITRQKKAEDEIRNALEKERQVNELKSRFIAMASHEFRTPLSTILSSVSLIARYAREEDADKRLRHIERIQKNVRHLTDILDDFLSLSKLEEGKLHIHYSTFDGEAFCRELAEEMQIQVRPGQQIRFSHSGHTEVCLDRQLLRHIALNLLSNAVKYSPEGAEIDFGLRVGEEEIELMVQDRGIGIPEEEQAHLFERFFRARNATNIQGTGLGLNIVQRYVSLLGGELSFRSALNQGSTFRIQFPRRKEDGGCEGEATDLA